MVRRLSRGMTETKPCPVCGEPSRPLKDWLYRCPACAFEFSTLTSGGGTGIEGLETLRKTNFRILLDRLERHFSLKDARAIEIGPADGWFLDAAAARGINISGIEPDRALAEKARARGLHVATGFFPDDLKDAGPYSLIVFNDVFEHLPDPEGAFRHVERLLAPDGLLVINLPSSGGALYRLAKLLARFGIDAPLERLWQKGLPSPHLSLFNPMNLRLLARRSAGFDPVDTFALRTITREGLAERISSTHGGIVGAVLFAGVWLLSFVYVPPLALSDIFVGVFRKGRIDG
ncbi:MAG: class I SAM-dependent methyltransferase [Elusimicrobiota bacterium]